MTSSWHLLTLRPNCSNLSVPAAFTSEWPRFREGAQSGTPANTKTTFSLKENWLKPWHLLKMIRLVCLKSKAITPMNLAEPSRWQVLKPLCMKKTTLVVWLWHVSLSSVSVTRPLWLRWQWSWHYTVFTLWPSYLKTRLAKQNQLSQVSSAVGYDTVYGYVSKAIASSATQVST